MTLIQLQGPLGGYEVATCGPLCACRVVRGSRTPRSKYKCARIMRSAGDLRRAQALCARVTGGEGTEPEGGAG